MGVVEQVVDAAAKFIGPFIDAGVKYDGQHNGGKDFDNVALVREAIEHLQAINTADLAADPNAPYDASLAGVVYGLLDLTTSLGVLPYLSSGVAFSQRPRSVLITSLTVSSSPYEGLLSETMQALLPILEQKEGTGLHSLIVQRSLPDIVSALAELSFSPQHTQQIRLTFEPAYKNLLSRTPTSRLLPVLTTFLQQPLPTWLKPRMAKELAAVPIRPQGIRHVIEFLSLSYLSKTSKVSQYTSGPQSQIPISIEAVTQASRLLISPPSGTSQEEWLQKLEPQLWGLLDGDDGRELSRAAGQIIAGGVLSKKSTGAPGTAGWQMFAQPILETICPKDTATAVLRTSTKDRVLIQDQDLLLALQRLSVLTTSYSHAGLIKRLVGPIQLPIWALLNYARSKPSLDKAWSELPRNIMLRYLMNACDAKQIDTITTSLFWDGSSVWTLGPGTKGGIEIRMRRGQHLGSAEEMESILSRISELDGRVNLLVSLLADANVSDDIVGPVFLQVTKRWLNPNTSTKATLLLESDDDPLTALTDAKLLQALASEFKDNFARSPQHIIELMNQLLQNYVSGHRVKLERQSSSHIPSRANLGNIAMLKPGIGGNISEGDTADDDVASFAISILNTLMTTPDLVRNSRSDALLSQITGHLQYLVHAHHQTSIQSAIANSASSLLQVLKPTASTLNPGRPDADPLAEHRTTLKAALRGLNSPEAPDRTWALSTLLRLIQNTTSFPVIDIPSTTYLVLSATLADPEPYVHTAAIPVLVSLALHTPHPVIEILVDAFVDVYERGPKLSKGKMTDAKQLELQEALDYRLRIGEVLNNMLLDENSRVHNSRSSTDMGVEYTSVKHVASACLSLSSRRGQRHETQSSRQAVSLQIVQQQKEAEAAWGGPIPNIFEADSEASTADHADEEALSKIVKGWEDTGIEEDVRIRTSAMSIFGIMLEKRLQFVTQATVDAGLQMVLLILTMENAETLSILRRAAVLVVMGLLRALDQTLDAGEDSNVSLGMKQQGEMERVLRWVRDEDRDELVRDHAESVLEGLETLRMKKLYKIRNKSLEPGLNLGLEGGLRGLIVRPGVHDKQQQKTRMIVEEVE